MIKGSDIAVGRTKRAAQRALGQKLQSLEATTVSLARSAASYWPAALRPRPQRSPRLNLLPEVFLNTPTRDPRPGRFCCASRPFLKPQRKQPHHLNNLLHNCAQPPATFEKIQNASPAPPRPPGSRVPDAARLRVQPQAPTASSHATLLQATRTLGRPDVPVRRRIHHASAARPRLQRLQPSRGRLGMVDSICSPATPPVDSAQSLKPQPLSAHRCLPDRRG